MMELKIKKAFILIVFWGLFCFSQNDSTYYFFDRTTPKQEVLNRIKKLKTETLKDYYWLVYYSRIRNADSMIYYCDKTERNIHLKPQLTAKHLFFKAYYYRITQNDSLSYIYHNLALKEGFKIDDTLSILYALSGLAQSFNYEENKAYRIDYLNELEEKAVLFQNSYFKIASSFLKGNYYLFRDSHKQALMYYKNTLKNNFSKKDSSLLINTLSNIGILYNDVLENPDSSIYYNQKKLQIINSNKAFQNTSNYFSTYLNIASAFRNNKEIDKSIEFLDKADSINIKEFYLTRKLTLKESLAKSYSEIGNYKLAFKNYIEYSKLKDSLNRNKLKEGIAKFDNQKLRADNLESESKRKQNRNLLYGALGLLVLGGIIFFLIQKNTKRKQKLTEQEKQLESQKLANVLKEQELIAIDAMIEGQEKERQRIANDLHDDLGGLMANVKLHFNALKDSKNKEDLFAKTDALLEQAYQKVRTIAHVKNAGVIAEQNLLKAVQHMAEKISATNKISIEVIHHGLNTRLDNSLELTLFRIIQELTTNIIKHAQATEASIHLTNHDDSINILIEDNGIGFNPKQLRNQSKGMGLSSIDKRVDHLNGTFAIESENNQGTSIIIDIPL